MIYETAVAVLNELTSAGYRVAISSVDRLTDLEEEYRKIISREEWRKSPHLSQHQFDFSLPQDFQARSIIVVATPVAPVNIGFVFNHRHFIFEAPPLSEDYETDIANIRGAIKQIISPRGYHLGESNLPTKLLASHIGLISNGINNIGYIEGMGSYFRLGAYFSDIDPGPVEWRKEHPVNTECSVCLRCINACPTKCIGTNSFNVSHCLSLLSKEPSEFPVWVNPRWHNSLIGCRICQKVCPLNQGISFKASVGTEFSDVETNDILAGVPLESLNSVTRKKLRYFNLEPLYSVLPRNLRLLLEREGLAVT